MTKRSPAMTRNRTNRGLGVTSCIPHGAFSTNFLCGIVFSILRRVFSKTLSGVSSSSCKLRRNSDRLFKLMYIARPSAGCCGTYAMARLNLSPSAAVFVAMMLWMVQCFKVVGILFVWTVHDEGPRNCGFFCADSWRLT